MNKIYKVVWSQTKNCYVIASEFAKSKSARAIMAAGIIALAPMATYADSTALGETAATSGSADASGLHSVAVGFIQQLMLQIQLR